jgi:hypothetical protein
MGYFKLKDPLTILSTYNVPMPPHNSLVYLSSNCPAHLDQELMEKTKKEISERTKGLA